MENLLQKKSSQNKNGNFFISYKFTLLIVFLGLIILCAFAFKSFGKTTHTISFDLICGELNENTKQNEIAEIQIMRKNEEFEPVVNNKVTVNAGESIKFRVSLKDGYEPITKKEGLNYLLATIINKSSGHEEKNREEMTSYFTDDSFEWTTDPITDDKHIEIKGIKIIDLNASEPNFVTSEGEILDKSKFIVNWQDTFKYDNKYRFDINLNEETEPYGLKSVTAETINEGVTTQLSCEISKENNGKHEVTIYNHFNRFGGIRSSISKIEVTLEPKYQDDQLSPALADGEESETPAKTYAFNFKGKDNKEGNFIDLTSDQVELYVYTGSAQDVENMPEYDLNSVDFKNVSYVSPTESEKGYLNYTSDSTNKIIFYLKPTENYSESNLEVENFTNLGAKRGFEVYEATGSDDTTDIYINGIALNCNVDFYRIDDSGKLNLTTEDMEIYVYEGSDSSLVCPLDENESLKDGVKSVTSKEENSIQYLNFLSSQGRSCTFFVRTKARDSIISEYNDITLTYRDTTGVEHTLDAAALPPGTTDSERKNFLKYTVNSLDVNSTDNTPGNFEINIKIVNKCNIKFMGDESPENLGNYLALNSDQVSIYIYKGAGEAPESPNDFTNTEFYTEVDNKTFEHVEEWGKSFTFYVVLNTGYTDSQFTVLKVSNDDNLGDYTKKKFSTNVPAASEMIISIKGIELNKYKVKLTFDGSKVTELKKISSNEEKTLFSGSDDDITIEDTVKHGESLKYEFNIDYIYTFEFCKVTVNNVEYDNVEKTSIKLTINLDKVNENKNIVISGINSKMCRLEFLDENGNKFDIEDQIEEDDEDNEIIVKEQILSITSEYGGSSLAENQTKVNIAGDFKFIIKMMEGYNGNELKVTEPDKTETSYSIYDKDGYHFTISKETLQQAYDDSAENDRKCTLIVKGVVALHDITFLWDAKYDDSILTVSYNEYNNNNNGEAEHTVTQGKTIQHLIPNGKDFQFEVKVNSDKYKLDENFINSDEIKKSNLVSEVTINKAADERSATVTLKKVTGDIVFGVKIELYECIYHAAFNIDEEFEDKITFYRATVTENDSGESNVTNGDKIYGGGVNGFEITFGKSENITFELDESCQINEQDFACTLNYGDESKECDFKIVNGKYLITIDTSGIDKNNEIELKINVSGISVKTFKAKFSLKGAEIIQYKNGFSEEATDTPIENEGTIDVKYGDSLYLEIQKTIDEEVDILDTLTIQESDTDKNISYTISLNNNNKNYRITISNVNTNIDFELNLDQEYSFVTFKACEGLSFYKVENDELSEVILGTISAVKNSDYKFAVKPDVGYDLNSVEMKVGEEYLTGEGNGDYFIYTISSDKLSGKTLTVEAKISHLKFNITFVSSYNLSDVTGENNEETQVTFYQGSKDVSSGISDVEYGKNIEVSLKLEEKCSNSDVKVKIYSKDAGNEIDELNLVSGKYKIINVTQNLEVRVEGIKLNQYVLNFVDNIAAYFLDAETENSLSGTKVVNYGENYEFKIKEKTGYVLGESMVVNIMSSSGASKELKPESSGVYKITNITDGYTITIENVENIIYNVSLANTEGVIYYNDQGATISGSFKVKYGQNFEFAVGVEDAYDESISNMYILVNDGNGSNVTAQKLASGRYLIQNITEDITIKVGNIVKNKYVVTLTDTEGIDYYSSSGAVITGDNQVGYGEDFYFKVKLYSAYSDSQIKVMLGNQEISIEENDMYRVPKVIENKIVMVVGVEKTASASLINKIETLPTSVENSNDMEAVIEATRLYNSLDESQKATIGNYDILKNLQESIAPLNHVYNGVTIEGLDWYIKIIANPILSDIDVCARIYEKLNSEYILSLYDVYLWDVINDCRYTLPEGQTVVVRFPTPDMTYFESPTGIHEKDDGKLNFLSLNMSNNTTSLETSSFSPMGIVARRSSVPGRSSLIDSLDANLSTLTDYTLTSLSGSSENSGTDSNKVEVNNTDQMVDQELNSADQQEEFKTENIGTTQLGSALKLVLILIIIGIIIAGIYVFIKNRKNKDDSD